MSLDLLVQMSRNMLLSKEIEPVGLGQETEADLESEVTRVLR
jgi:hypothetical protein